MRVWSRVSSLGLLLMLVLSILPVATLGDPVEEDATQQGSGDGTVFICVGFDGPAGCVVGRAHFSFKVSDTEKSARITSVYGSGSCEGPDEEGEYSGRLAVGAFEADCERLGIVWGSLLPLIEEPCEMDIDIESGTGGTYVSMQANGVGTCTTS